MAKINVLDSSVYNRIAAGEVVERPYSVVKELVENSIDAGAKNIQIDITDGGISSIKITDDGCGIEKEELKKSLMPHATSKISKVDDLDAIATLGFRGEALASIASVSKIKIASKPSGQEFGASISCEGGKNEILSDGALSDGTEITVKELFFNEISQNRRTVKCQCQCSGIFSIKYVFHSTGFDSKTDSHFIIIPVSEFAGYILSKPVHMQDQRWREFKRRGKIRNKKGLPVFQ